MKAELRKDGHVHIIAENIVEAYALLYLGKDTKICNTCGVGKYPIVINCSILNADTIDEDEDIEFDDCADGLPDSSAINLKNPVRRK